MPYPPEPVVTQAELSLLSEDDYKFVYKLAKELHMHVQSCKFWPNCKAYDVYMTQAYDRLQQLRRST